MREAMAGPVLVAAALLLISGLAKLRRPAAATLALRTLGVPATTAAVRALSAAELGLGTWSLVGGARFTAVLLALAYSAFAAVALALTARRAACGCFGSAEALASPLQAILSAAFALTCGVAIAWPPPRLGWALERSPALVLALAVGLAGGVYAAVTAYTQLAAAWTAWSGR